MDPKVGGKCLKYTQLKSRLTRSEKLGKLEVYNMMFINSIHKVDSKLQKLWFYKITPCGCGTCYNNAQHGFGFNLPWVGVSIGWE